MAQQQRNVSPHFGYLLLRFLRMTQYVFQPFLEEGPLFPCESFDHGPLELLKSEQRRPHAPAVPLCSPSGSASRKRPPLLAIEIPIRLRQTSITVRCPIFLPLCRATSRSIDSIK